MKSWAVYIIVSLVVVGVLYALSGKKFPQIPLDAAHQGLTAATVTDTNAACMGCHGPGKPNALKPNHPPKFSCFKCHKPKKRLA
ncbi:MAG: hypothetical protein M0Z52_04645 [Actinomycetota bacterium]|nr:hypothetical protein [Actinomycetota bacterium]